MASQDYLLFDNNNASQEKIVIRLIALIGTPASTPNLLRENSQINISYSVPNSKINFLLTVSFLIVSFQTIFIIFALSDRRKVDKWVKILIWPGPYSFKDFIFSWITLDYFHSSIF